MVMPWWFWFIPGTIFVVAAGIPLWGWLLKRSVPYRERDSDQ